MAFHSSVPFVLGAVVAASVAACGIEQLSQGGTSSGSAATSDGGADAAAEAGATGQGCGVESGTGATLCTVTSQCPSVPMDTETFPNCGYRIRGGLSELVCACGESICSMGAFTTCTQAAQLMASQSEASVCAQVGEGRCTAGSPVSGSGANPTCDRTCLSQCGGGAGCASICGC